MHRYIHGAPLRCAFMASSLVLMGCAGAPTPVLTPSAGAAYVASFGKAHAAGLAVYDALAPTLAGEGGADPYAAVLGPAELNGVSCETRYDADALRARCAALAAILAFNEAAVATNAGIDASPYLQIAAQSLALFSVTPQILPVAAKVAGDFTSLASDISASRRLTSGVAPIRALIAALREDAPRLYELERAAQAARLADGDHAYLAAMDEVFAAVTGRAAPRNPGARNALDRVAARLAPLLSRTAPAYGADSLFAVIDDSGRALTGPEIAALTPLIDEAEAAAARFDAIAGAWANIADAISAYDGLLLAVDQSLTANGAAQAVAMRNRAGEIKAALDGNKTEIR